MWEIPTTITLSGKEYPIRNKGDFRTITDVLLVISDEEYDTTENIIAAAYIFYEDFEGIPEDDKQQAYKEMIKFLSLGEEEEDNGKKQPKLMDWEQDEKLLIPAINKVAGKEIRFEPYVHWWTFMGYYNSIDGESSFAYIVSLRNKLKKNKKLTKEEKEFIRDNPQHFIWKKDRIRDKKLEDELRASFYTKKEVN